MYLVVTYMTIYTKLKMPVGILHKLQGAQQLHMHIVCYSTYCCPCVSGILPCAYCFFCVCAPLACRVAGQSMSVLELLAREIDGGVGLAELVSGIVVKRVE